MSRTILVPLDGSPDAEQALPWALTLAQHLQATLRVVSVHAPAAAFLDGQTLVGSVLADDEVRAQELHYLGTLVDRVRAATGTTLTADLVEGSVHETLQAHTQALAPPYVVMTAHGRSTIARFFVGSTAIDYLREATTPVFLIHTTTPDAPDLTTIPTIKHIVVPLDGSPFAEQSIAPALALGQLFHAAYHVLLTPPEPPDATYLAGIAARFAPHAVTTQHIHGPAVAAILHAAQERPETIIAIATHGRSGLAKMLWGSVTEEVIRHTTVPLLIVRPE